MYSELESESCIFFGNNMFALLTHIISKNNVTDVIKCSLNMLARKKTCIALLKTLARPINQRTFKQTKQENKATKTNKQTNKKEQKNGKNKKIEKAITGSGLVYLFGHIRDSVVIENMRAFIP